MNTDPNSKNSKLMQKSDIKCFGPVELSVTHFKFLVLVFRENKDFRDAKISTQFFIIFAYDRKVKALQAKFYLTPNFFAGSFGRTNE